MIKDGVCLLGKYIYTRHFNIRNITPSADKDKARLRLIYVRAFVLEYGTPGPHEYRLAPLCPSNITLFLSHIRRAEDGGGVWGGECQCLFSFRSINFLQIEFANKSRMLILLQNFIFYFEYSIVVRGCMLRP
jgi:hypothetical protein